MPPPTVPPPTVTLPLRAKKRHSLPFSHLQKKKSTLKFKKKHREDRSGPPPPTGQSPSFFRNPGLPRGGRRGPPPAAAGRSHGPRTAAASLPRTPPPALAAGPPPLVKPQIRGTGPLPNGAIAKDYENERNSWGCSRVVRVGGGESTSLTHHGTLQICRGKI